MNLTLSPEDGRAVDLLLNHSHSAAGNGHGQPLYAAPDPTIGQRVTRVQKMLELLEALPAGDPPHDLVRRTLQFVEEVEHRPAMRHQAPLLIGTQRPHA